MKDTKLLKLFKTLSPKEFKNFRAYLENFTKKTDPELQLLELIEEAFEAVKGKWNKFELSKDQVRQEIFPDKENEGTNILNLRSTLLTHLKNYCRFLQFHKEAEETDYLLKFLSERDAHELFEQEYRSHVKEVDKQKGVTHVKQRYEAFEVELNYFVKNQAKKQQPDYQQNFELFEDFVLVKKMQLYCYMFNRKMVSGLEFKKGFEKKMKQVFKVAQKRESIQFLANLYEKAILMLEQNENSYEAYEVFQGSLIEYKDVLERRDQQLLFTLIHTFLRKPALFQKKIENYRYRFEEGLLYDGDYLPVMHAKNLCTHILLDTEAVKKNGLSEKEAKYKIIKIINKMMPRYRDSTRKYNWGVLAFYFKDYQRAIQLLKQKRTYANDFFRFDARMILLRAYYFIENEKDVLDEFENEVRSFLAALKNAKNLADKHQEGYANYAQAIKKLYRIKYHIIDKDDKHDKIQGLEMFLRENTHKVKKAKWFLGQIEEIKKAR